MNAFDGVKVFCATMVAQRETLGEVATRWLEDARTRIPGFQLVEIMIRQSSDSAFHCVSIIIFYNQAPPATEKKHRG